MTEIATTRDDVEALEELMAQQPQIDLEVDHYFSDGLYGRAIFIPAGVAATGKVHKKDHLSFLMMGTLSVLTDDGMQTLTAPKIIKASKGTKRAVYSHTDSVWVTVHATDATDPEQAVDELVEPGRPEIEAMKKKILEVVK